MPVKMPAARLAVRAKRSSQLVHPSAQPFLPRLSGAGSLRRELEAVLDRAPANSTLGDYRQLILEGNIAGKRSASMRLWTWKRLKVRYLLDLQFPEFRAFRATIEATTEPSERGLIEFLMMSRTDRLFRDVTAETISPDLRRPGSVIDPQVLHRALGDIANRHDHDWSVSVLEGLTAHILSACKDYGLIRGSRVKRSAEVRPGPMTLSFAVRLGRMEGLSDRRNLESRWFRLLGLDARDVLDQLHRASRQGVLGFRFQADVAEIVLPEIEVAARCVGQ